MFVEYIQKVIQGTWSVLRPLWMEVAPRLTLCMAHSYVKI